MTPSVCRDDFATALSRTPFSIDTEAAISILPSPAVYAAEGYFQRVVVVKRKSGEREFLVLVGHIKEMGEPYDIELDETELADILKQADTGYWTAGEGVNAHLQLNRAVDNVLVRGDVELSVATACSRCLADLTRRLKIEIDWTFLPVTHNRLSSTEEGEAELTEEDLDVSFYEGEEIDIGQVIREAIFLELEPYPSCPDGCTGEEPELANAEEAELDPRWLPLLELKRKQRS